MTRVSAPNHGASNHWVCEMSMRCGIWEFQSAWVTQLRASADGASLGNGPKMQAGSGGGGLHGPQAVAALTPDP